MIKNLRRIFLFAVAVMALTACFVMSSSALTSGYYDYELLPDGTAEITKYTGGSKYTTLSIPSKLNNKNVTCIGSSAFQENQYIKTLTIPSGVKTIKAKAFYECSAIETLNLPTTLTTINDYAFEGCKKLKSLSIPSSITDIGYSAFAYCEALKTIAIPDTPINIGRYSFYITGYYNTASNWVNGKALYLGKHLIATKNLGETFTVRDGTITLGGGCLSYHQNLKSIQLPNSLKRIGLRAIAELPKLSEITIPDSVTYLGYRAFWNCRELKNINIPESVTVMGESCFLDCISLEKIELPDSITYLNSACFKGCTSLKSIKLPSQIKTLGVDYLNGCKALTSITLPDSCTKIATGGFGDCTALKTVTIPGGVTNIESKAFNKCTALKTVNFLGTKAQWNSATIATGNDPLKGATIHYFTNYLADTYENCLSDRTKTAKCTDCSAKHTVTDPGTAKKSHGTISYVAAKAATCTKQGNKAYYKCSACKSVFSDSAGKNVLKSSDIIISSAGKHNNKSTVTQATLSKNGSKVNKCTVCGEVVSSTVIYYPKTISISATSYTYDGKAKTPTVTVKNSKGTALKKDTDYTVSYSSGRTKVGRYTVTVKFKGDYSGSKSFKFAIYPKTVTSCKATQTTTSIKLTWGKASGATGYGVYKYDSKTKKYTLLKKVTGTSYTISKLSAGKKYAYSIRPYAVVNNETFAASYSKIFSTSTKPAKVTNFKITKKTSTAYTFTWKAVSGATGYRVYSYDAKTKKYTSLGSVTGKNKLTVKNIKKTASYQFVVRAYINNDLGTVWSDYSAKLIVVGTPSGLKGVVQKNRVITLSWSDVSGKSGYEVYCSSNNKTFTKIYDTNDVAMLYGPCPIGTYYFRVRAYVRSGSKTYYGAYVSTSVKVR